MPGLSDLERLNRLAPGDCAASLRRCCASGAWIRRMVDARPFESAEALLDASDRIWRSLARDDWLEAFAAHPRIGAAAAEGWSGDEQAGAAAADAATRARLVQANREYDRRFGHIFIVCATGKTAEEMLAMLRARLANDPATELAIASEEQRKITRLRLEKLLAGT
jgi:OHCU decarboxylase